ncbi:MAG: hypothetical protein GF307_12430 [candidate division Zixibacteria bacterium]|nr:hypothetical protein [candidate division Zixibacteria bacterium]
MPEEITEEDERSFFKIISTKLSDEQLQRVSIPPETYPKEHSVLAIHWHPEFVPMDTIRKRIDTTFPEQENSLIIPTQHNVLMQYDNFYGAEVDCYSRQFNQKVQLLLHFNQNRLERAETLKSMLDYTFTYRSSQLYDFMDTILKPVEGRMKIAARETGADTMLVHLVTVYVGKIKKLLETHENKVPPEMIKNKLLRNFFDTLREKYGHGLINRAQAFLKAVKTLVKAEFPLPYFYRTEEIIEEARSIGAGVVVPHPEQFWPILLAEYDIDGFEVWNPQSRKYTEFLISVIDKHNKRIGLSRRKLLIFMGDDTHMGEKVKDPIHQDEAKASREIGVQPAWKDLHIRKKLILAKMQKDDVINEYRERLT